MKLMEADQILGEKYPGKYRACQIEVTTFSDGCRKEFECGVYVEGRKWQTGASFQEALDKLFNNVEDADVSDGVQDE